MATGPSWWLLLFMWICIIQAARPHKILFIGANVGSHMMYIGNLAESFVAKGHDVTLLVSDSTKIPADITKHNLNTIRFQSPVPIVTEEAQKIFEEMAFNPSLKSQLLVLSLLSNNNNEAGYHLMEDHAAMAKVASANFDYAVVDPVTMSFLMVPYKLDIPYGLVAVDCFGPVRRIPLMPSYNPNILTAFTDSMTFFQRLANFLLAVGITGFRFSAADITKKYVPEKPATGFDELIRNASLCLQLRDNMMDFTRPEMPDVIPMAMAMGRPSNPLPGDLENFMQSSQYGVILFSFGSAIPELPGDVLQKIFEALGSLEQKVIFKYKQELSNAPSNVRIMNWIPQNDLLGHPKLKLFITHCGMNGLIEAVYHGVPLLGFPFALDQPSNGALVRGKGIGKTMALSDFTAQELKDNIVKIISDGKYATAAKKMSAVYRDVQKSGLRDPVYWVEHVIKHGALHLRTHAYDMPDYQYYMIDVIGFLLVSLTVLMCVAYVMLRLIVRCMCGRKSEKTKTE